MNGVTGMAWVLVLLLPDVSPLPDRFEPQRIGLRHVLTNHTTPVTHVAFGGRYLASADGTGQVSICNAKTWAEVHHLQAHAGPVLALSFNSDGSQLLTADSNEISLWGTASGEKVNSLESPDLITAAYYSDTEILRSLQTDALERVDITSNTIRNSWVCRLGSLASVHADLLVKVMLRKDGEVLEPIEHISISSPLAVDPAGHIVYAVNSDGAYAVIDVERWEMVRTFGVAGRDVRDLALTRDGRHLIAAGEAISFWDVRTGEEVGRIRQHNGGVYGLAISPDSRTLASACGDYFVRIWGDAPGGLAGIRLKGYLGVSMSEGGGGVEVQQVVAGAPAERAGVQIGDAIVRVGGIDIASVGDAMVHIGKYLEGDEVEFVIRRGGEDLKKSITLTRRPELAE